MKNWITKAVTGLFALGTFVLTSCEKDESRVVLNANAAPQLTASATTASLSPTQSSSAEAVTYTWSAADFGYNAAVTYTLQLAKQGTNFANAQEFNMNSALTKSFTAGELNSVYNGLDCNITAVVATPLDVRVKASVGGKVDPIYSPVSTLTAAPFQAQALPANKWAIIGSATPGGWDKETPMSYDFCSRTWSVTLPLTVAEYKFRANNAWDTNLGDAGTGSVNTGRELVYNVAPTPNPPNLKVDEAGMYTVTLDINATPKPKYTLKKN